MGFCQVIHAPRLPAQRSVMISKVSQPRQKGFGFPRFVISCAVWAYDGFALILRNVEDLLVERGVIVSCESVRVWCQRFGAQVAATGQPRPINSKLWRCRPAALPKCQAPLAQWVEQPVRSLASTHKTTRKDHGPLQVFAPGVEISFGLRSDRNNVPYEAPSRLCNILPPLPD